MEPLPALLALSEENPSVPSGFPVKMASYVKLWCFVVKTNKTFEQTLEWLVILDDMALM